MIARIEGRLLEKSPELVLVDVGGVGYELRVPLSSYLQLPAEGERLVLRVHTYVREDILQLYGFMSEAERIAFGVLIAISKVGPRLALAILSGLPVAALVAAVRQNNVVALRGIPGIGAKTAERILIELRDRVAVLEKLPQVGTALEPEPVSDVEGETISALVNLGYPRAQAERAVGLAANGLEEPTLETLIREALRVVSG